MKIHIKNVSNDGIEVKKTLTSAEVGFKDDEVICLSPLTINAKLYSADEAVIVKANVIGKYRYPCSKCLEPVEEERDDLFDFIVEVDETTEFIDLTEDIRQEMIIAFSSAILCSEDCKGLCLGCGEILNLGECKCK